MKKSIVFGSFLLAAVSACSSSESNGGGSGGTNNSVGGSSASSSTTASTGGKTSSSSTKQTGGDSGDTGGKSSTSSKSSVGGSSATGGKSATGGGSATGGKSATGGGSATGGKSATGGGSAVGGATAAGGTSATSSATSSGTSTTGGTTTDGGSSATGSTNIGGTTTNGGSSTNGGATTAGGTTTAGGSSGVTVQLDATHQTIQGFGINDTWADVNLPAKVFSTTDPDGLGLSILRVGMGDNGSDYSTNISTDISTAKAAGAKIIGSCWSPPANCKTNNNVNDGGHLKESCYDSWAKTIATWAKSKGLYAMSIGNEPDFASCGKSEPCNGNYPTTVFTAAEMVKWVKTAGKALHDQSVKVIAPEASEWIHQWSNISATGSVPGNMHSSDPLKCGCFGNDISETLEATCTADCRGGNGYDYGHWLAKDTEAWAAFDIVGVHEYDSQKAYVWPADVTGGKRDKEIWQTEMSGVKWWPEQGTGTGSSLVGSTTIENGVAVAGWIHSALVVGEASAWLYWWYKPLSSGDTDDNEGLLLKDGKTVAKRYYTLGNYSKFVRPGQIMVDVTGNTNADVLLSAFKGASDGTVVVVAINKGSAAASIPITIAGGTAPASCTPNVTSASDNLKAGSAVTVTGGVFTAALASKTVTTYVCK